ncbi:MAG: hypothetical protein D9V44_08730 [Actinobacteria bacterium]|nr:MAG: hypothetical protein D9V44_08730 [Actinomycetota bacterium]
MVTFDIDTYLAALRRGLRGLPRPDVDAIVAETQSHLRDTMADGASFEAAIGEFGPADAVAAEVIEGRIRPEGGEPLPRPGRRRRFSAWLADTVIGWGPLAINPVWMSLIGWVQLFVMMNAEERAAMEAIAGADMYSALFSPFMLATAVASLAWGLFYWLWARRGRSSSVGMRMAGISRVVGTSGVEIVDTASVAVTEPARIVARAKWYLAAPTALFGAIVALVVAYYGVMAVGSFFQPFNRLLGEQATAAELEGARDTYAAFYDAVVAGDVATAKAYATETAAAEVDEFVAGRQADGVTAWAFGPALPPNEWVIVETLGTGADAKTREVFVTVERTQDTGDPAKTIVRYRISFFTDDAMSESRPGNQ